MYVRSAQLCYSVDSVTLCSVYVCVEIGGCSQRLLDEELTAKTA
jgi:hypothetical protein